MYTESLKSKKLKKKIIATILVALMLLAAIMLPTVAHAATTPTPTSTTAKAASSAPYKDVTVKSVGQDTYNAISYIKTHKGYVKLFTGQKFYPNKKITRRQFLIILKNLYGNNKVPVTLSDMRNMNKFITAKYACDKLVEVAKKFGMKMKWSNIPKITLTRGAASLYIKIFIDFTKLKPKQ